MKFGMRELTFFLLLAAIPCAAIFFVFWPSAKQAARLVEETRDKRVRLSQLDRLGQTSDQLARELQELAKALDFFESKLPSSQQIHTVLGEVTQITERWGLTTKSVRTLKQTETADYVDQPIEVELSGRFEGFYQFLLDVERMPRITRISQMDLKKDNVEGHVQVRLVMSIYFESPRPNDPPRKGPLAPAGSPAPGGLRTTSAAKTTGGVL